MPVSTRRHPDDSVERALEDAQPSLENDAEALQEQHQPQVTPRVDRAEASRSSTLRCVNAVPPSGESWTSHSLRKGAASAAAAIGVVLDRICHFGGWSIHSGVVHDYIDPACPASDAAYAFFGWLLPPHMARSVSVG